MSQWNRIVRDYFTFNKRERRGLFVLLFLLFTTICVRIGIEYWPKEKLEVTFRPLPEVNSEAPRIAFPIEIDDESTERHTIVWRPFDPNTATSIELIELGLDSNVAERLVKYRENGGSYYELKDLEKLYGMNQNWLQEASSFIRFPLEQRVNEVQATDSSSKMSSSTHKVVPIELNAADTNELKNLPWIGSYYAREIVELRSRLGGFYNYDQLLEIYKIRDEAIESIVDHSSLDTNQVHKISLNTCDVDQLGRHPYISWKQAKIVVNYRLQHGAYKQKRDILNTDVINDSVYLKIAPYLIIE